MAISNDTLGAAIAIFESKSDAGIISGRVDAIEAKIPDEASSSNKLADKDYVDDSINQSSAYFRGSFATKAALLAVQWQTTSKLAPYYVSNNDYSVVEQDETHSNETWRYIYIYEVGGSNNGWAAQYRINENVETMTMAQYEQLTPAQKADGTIRFITDANSYPDAGGVGF